MAKKWYVIHTYSGYENKVKTNLEHRIESMNMAHKIFTVFIPKETITEIKQGGRKVPATSWSRCSLTTTRGTWSATLPA
jgi:transcriptional antiterminator NusG